jgi:hypothetical protein
MKDDYHYIPERQAEIATRLEHWAIWVNPRQCVWRTQPMFRQYRSHAWQWERPELKVQINGIEAMEIEKLVCQLPEKNRDAIRWAYVFTFIPVNIVRRELGVTREGLASLIVNGRDMLKNKLSRGIAHS